MFQLQINSVISLKAQQNHKSTQSFHFLNFLIQNIWKDLQTICHIGIYFEREMHFNQSNSPFLNSFESPHGRSFFLRPNSRMTTGWDGRTFRFGSWQAQNVYKCVWVRRPWLLRNTPGIWYQLSASCSRLLQGDIEWLYRHHHTCTSLMPVKNSLKLLYMNYNILQQNAQC